MPKAQSHASPHSAPRVVPGHRYGTLVPRYHMPSMKKRPGGWRAGCRHCHAQVIVPAGQLLAGRCPSCYRN